MRIMAKRNTLLEGPTISSLKTKAAGVFVHPHRVSNTADKGRKSLACVQLSDLHWKTLECLCGAICLEKRYAGFSGNLPYN